MSNVKMGAMKYIQSIARNSYLMQEKDDGRKIQRLARNLESRYTNDNTWEGA